MAQQAVCTRTSLALARRINLLVALVAPIACWPRTLGVVALVDLGVGITKLDGNVANQLVLESDSLHTRNGLDDGRLSVSDVADGTNVDGGLPRNNLGSQRAEGLDIKILGFCLRREVRLCDGCWGSLLHGRLAGLGGGLVARLLGLDLGLIAGVRLGLDVVSELIAV